MRLFPGFYLRFITHPNLFTWFLHCFFSDFRPCCLNVSHINKQVVSGTKNDCLNDQTVHLRKGTRIRRRYWAHQGRSLQKGRNLREDDPWVLHGTRIHINGKHTLLHGMHSSFVVFNQKWGVACLITFLFRSHGNAIIKCSWQFRFCRSFQQYLFILSASDVDIFE